MQKNSEMTDNLAGCGKSAENITPKSPMFAPSMSSAQPNGRLNKSSQERRGFGVLGVSGKAGMKTTPTNGLKCGCSYSKGVQKLCPEMRVVANRLKKAIKALDSNDLTGIRELDEI